MTPAQSHDLQLDEDSKRRTSPIFQPVRSPLAQNHYFGQFVSVNLFQVSSAVKNFEKNLPTDVPPVKIHSCSQSWCSEQQKCKYLTLYQLPKALLLKISLGPKLTQWKIEGITPSEKVKVQNIWNKHISYSGWSVCTLIKDTWKKKKKLALLLAIDQSSLTKCKQRT